MSFDLTLPADAQIPSRRKRQYNFWGPQLPRLVELVGKGYGPKAIAAILSQEYPDNPRTENQVSVKCFRLRETGKLSPGSHP